MFDEALETIIVASDFSPCAADALRFAARIARQHDARLRIVHAVDAITIPHPSIDMQAALRERLAELDGICAEAGVESESRYATGHAWDVVAEETRADQVGLVVVGSRGWSEVSWLHLGRTADRILRSVSAPVVTVPLGTRATPPERILVALDFSQYSEAALHVAQRLASGQGAAPIFRLVHAWQPLVDYELGPIGGIPAVLDDGGSAAEAQLDAVANALKREGAQVESSVQQGYPVAVIEREAQAWEADLITLGTHGHTGLAHLLLGSVAERIVHRAPCSVLTVGARVVSERADNPTGNSASTTG